MVSDTLFSVGEERGEPLKRVQAAADVGQLIDQSLVRYTVERFGEIQHQGSCEHVVVDSFKPVVSSKKKGSFTAGLFPESKLRVRNYGVDFTRNI